MARGGVVAITRRKADVSVHDLSTEAGRARQLTVMAIVSVARRGETMLRELARKIDAFQERLGRAVSWLMVVMVAVVFVDVIGRYAFKKSSVFTHEMEWWLFGLVYLLAAGYTMLYDEHVRVDILYSSWTPRKKAWSDFIFMFVFFFP